MLSDSPHLGLFTFYQLIIPTLGNFFYPHSRTAPPYPQNVDNLHFFKNASLSNIQLLYLVQIYLFISLALDTNDIIILHACLTSYLSSLRSTARYLVVLLWFWVVRVKKKIITVSSWFQGKVNFFNNQIFNQFYDSLCFF